MHLLDKLEKLGLDEVNQTFSSVSPTTLRVALENLTYVTDGHHDDSDAWQISKDGVASSESRSPIRRNLSNSSVENVPSPKLSPMHRSSSVGLNMICDLGSPPSSIASNFDIRAKFQVVWQQLCLGLKFFFPSIPPWWKTLKVDCRMSSFWYYGHLPRKRERERVVESGWEIRKVSECATISHWHFSNAISPLFLLN